MSPDQGQGCLVAGERQRAQPETWETPPELRKMICCEDDPMLEQLHLPPMKEKPGPPLQPGGSPALNKIYPRGSHWAVGHLMGKKSAGDFPSVDEEENKIPLSASPENTKQLEDYLQWEEMSKYLLRLLEGNENKSAHVLKGGLPWYTRSAWETDGSSSWKNMMEYLLQVVNMKESSPS
ncbi:PREDICTED: gastrin-releasing peptide [Tinamus guttatus]|uniref:gastrin-releasing peptide n=1 Tax=Tinamus guttatus TaxID=94827 RepID=UPI00052EC399|nr:PREDICTED: gastrin-releasing peptide [Tinamus guttatus]